MNNNKNANKVSNKGRYFLMALSGVVLAGSISGLVVPCVLSKRVTSDIVVISRNECIENYKTFLNNYQSIDHQQLFGYNYINSIKAGGQELPITHATNLFELADEEATQFSRYSGTPIEGFDLADYLAGNELDRVEYYLPPEGTEGVTYTYNKSKQIMSCTYKDPTTNEITYHMACNSYTWITKAYIVEDGQTYVDFEADYNKDPILVDGPASLSIRETSSPYVISWYEYYLDKDGKIAAEIGIYDTVGLETPTVEVYVNDTKLPNGEYSFDEENDILYINSRTLTALDRISISLTNE